MKIIRKLEVNLRYIFWALKQTFKPTTYDFVLYKEEKYYIKSSLTGNNIWNLYKSGNKDPIHYQIHGSQLNIILSIKRFRRVFKDNLRFQLSSWSLIDYNKPIGTRLSFINSDNIHV